MSALDDVILAGGTSVPVTPPQPVAVTSGALPPVTPPAPVSLNPTGDALHQALAIRAAAQKATAADPMAQQAQEAIDSDAAASEVSAKAIDENMARIKELQGQAPSPRPDLPSLTPTAAPPPVVHKDPLRVFGQFLPVIAALGALTTREPAINALTAATAMINAAKTNDKEEEAKQRQAWLDNTKAAVENNTNLLTQYKLAFDDRTQSITERMAQINAIAAQNKDYVTLAALRGGGLDQLVKFWQLQSSATDHLTGLTTQLSAQDLQAKQLASQEMHQFAELEIQRRKSQNISMGDAMGTILNKISQSGQIDPQTGQPITLDKVLSPGERQALQTYMRINARGQYSDDPGAAQGVGGLAGIDTGTPPPAGAPRPTPAPTPAAAPASAPPATGIVAAPQNPRDRHVGQWYGTPKGPLMWMGDGWRAPPAG